MFQFSLRFIQLHLWPSLLVAGSTVALVVKLGLPVVKEWFGFKKDVLDTKKTELELKDLEEKRSSRIQIATFADVERFDPRVRDIYRYIPQAAAPPRPPSPAPPPASYLPVWLWIVAVLGVIGGIVAYFIAK